jgi:hypothetical protein
MLDSRQSVNTPLLHSDEEDEVSPSKDDIFADRRKSLEEEFFRKQDKHLIERLRANEGRKALKEALAQTGSRFDDSIVDRLVELGVTAETVASVLLAPLVVVAWADGHLDKKERQAVLQGAESRGLQQGTPAHALLEEWLKEKPGAKLLHAWEDYVRTLAGAVSQEERDRLKTRILGYARDVAQASGGFLGMGPKISAVENEVLQRLERAFDVAT